MKRRDHVKHRIRPDIFVMEHHDILIGKQRCYIDTLNIEKMKARLKVIVFSVNHYLLFIKEQLQKSKSKPMEEKWSKRVKQGKTRNDTYQKPPNEKLHATL